MSLTPQYRGRFAPSPSGPLHFGSLVAALGSYLDAKHQHGRWLVCMEDLDTPRTVFGAADHILHTLECFGLLWDEDVIYQSHRTHAYEEALLHLQRTNNAYPCACTRKEIADSALHTPTSGNMDGLVYPGTCRDGIQSGRSGRAWRVRTDSKPIVFNDMLQGCVSQQLEIECGDFVVKRADGLFAYQLAVVVDDAFQSISHVVRGADLLDSTPRQIHLQRLLGLNTPHYMHLPVAINLQGEKLSKQTLATALDQTQPGRQLLHALQFLQQNPPAELADYDVTTILNWAIAQWTRETLKNIRHIQYIE